MCTTGSAKSYLRVTNIGSRGGCECSDDAYQAKLLSTLPGCVDSPYMHSSRCSTDLLLPRLRSRFHQQGTQLLKNSSFLCI